MDSKLIGSILMILGTSIGAGMIALPVSTAGYAPPTILLTLLICWFVSLLGALALAELSLEMSGQSNLISIAKRWTGPVGSNLAWIMYLALMVSLTCAYLAGSGEILSSLLSYWDIELPHWLAITLCLLFFAAILSRGIGTVDVINRLLMSSKAIIYAILVVSIIPYLEQSHLEAQHQSAALWPAGMLGVILTSFGYSVIVPTLTHYLDNERARIYKAITIGSLLPLLIYIVWIFVIQALIPSEGEHGLLAIATTENTNGAIINALNTLTKTPWLSNAIETFMALAITTSFLGVSLSLSELIADGLHLKKSGKSGIIVYTLTFAPCLLIVLKAPNLFITALEYAGFICFTFLIVFPIILLVLSKTRK